ncbi:hypothetical protein OG229_36920 [Streptomyces platensis]|nr:hypothetical protein OG229_36920 [Streptomyces platensis]
MLTVLDLDACPTGWLAVKLRDGRSAEAQGVTALRSLVADAVAVGVAVVTVDVSLGASTPGGGRRTQRRRPSWDREKAALSGRSHAKCGRRRSTTMRSAGAADSPAPD